MRPNATRRWRCSASRARPPRRRRRRGCRRWRSGCRRCSTDRDVRREFGASVVAWLAATMPRLFSSADDEEIGSIGLGLFEEEGRDDDAASEGEGVGGPSGCARASRRAWSAAWHREWNAGWRKAWERGLAQGMERGLAQGVERGLAQGVERGLAQGVERGLAQERSLLREQAARKFGAAVGEALARRPGVGLGRRGASGGRCPDHRLRRRRGAARPHPPARRRLRPPSPTFTTFSPVLQPCAAGPRGPSRSSPGRRCVPGDRGRPRRRTRCRGQMVCPV